MIAVLIAFLAAACAGWIILRSRAIHGSLTADTVSNGPQKIHKVPVPRVGGIAVFVGFLAGSLFGAWHGYVSWLTAALIVVCGLPAFLGGLFEDITKRGGVLMRLMATFVSAGLAFWLLDAKLDRLDVPLLDSWLRIMPLSLLFTMFAAGGVSQSLNLIDGLNGLAAFVGMCILAGIGFLAWKIGDPLVMCICLSAVGGIFGFFVWNFPRGRIFCGDGGAYFIGFVIAEVSVLLVHRHAQVSAWFPLVLAIYPIWETVFSIYRRRVARKSATQPDALHFHSLVYRRVARTLQFDARATGPGDQSWRANALSAMFCWPLSVGAALAALSYWDSTTGLIWCAISFAAAYVLVYRWLASKRHWRNLLRRQLELDALARATLSETAMGRGEARPG